MKIKRELYHILIETSPVVPPETGGLLGGQNNIVTVYVADQGIGDGFNRYVPNVDALNSVIMKWNQQEIDFLGLYHTHYLGGYGLSDGDILYIKAILMAMPERVQRLYFPLVFPSDQMLCFTAERKDNGVYISEDIIELI